MCLLYAAVIIFDVALGQFITIDKHTHTLETERSGHSSGPLRYSSIIGSRAGRGSAALGRIIPRQAANPGMLAGECHVTAQVVRGE